MFEKNKIKTFTSTNKYKKESFVSQSTSINMDDYMDYIKCGDILVPPALNCKDQYILKCAECQEYYSSLGEFLSHFISHYNVEVNEQTFDENISIKAEYGEYAAEEVLITNEKDSFKTKKLQMSVTKEEPSILGEASFHTYADEADEENMEEKLIDYPETDEEDSEDINTSKFVTNFMASKEKLKTFITAYKNQPHLWNSKLPKRARSKERPKDLQNIVLRLKEQINQQVTINQVQSIIRRLLLNYREKLKSNAETIKNKNQSPLWFMEDLHFLEPHMENKSVVMLDSLPPAISTEQITQILGIYKRFPNLWNTDLIENCCTNKRLESLDQMESVVESEIGLKINQNTLKRYIRCIHYHFSREKRQDMSNVETTDGRTEYYKHMIFLADHVGPFKCTDCKREFKSPLALKVHKSQHDGSIPLKCSICNKDYKTTEAYMSHARRHMNDLKQQCTECGKKFLKYTELEVHMRFHTGAKPFFCELCGASFRHNHAFATHKRRHEKKYLHNCPICAKGFYKKDHMDNHLRTHGILQDFICKLCSKGFKSEKTLQQHELTHKEKNSRKTKD